MFYSSLSAAVKKTGNQQFRFRNVKSKDTFIGSFGRQHGIHFNEIRRSKFAKSTFIFFFNVLSSSSTNYTAIPNAPYSF